MVPDTVGPAVSEVDDPLVVLPVDCRPQVVLVSYRAPVCRGFTGNSRIFHFQAVASHHWVGLAGNLVLGQAGALELQRLSCATERTITFDCGRFFLLARTAVLLMTKAHHT